MQYLGKIANKYQNLLVQVPTLDLVTAISLLDVVFTAR